jgi:two-component system phosphate regulon sensor histidine kinase PhoR
LKKLPVRWGSLLLIFYLLAAFGWWAVHLWQENDRLWATRKELLLTRYKNSGVNLTQLEQTQEYRGFENDMRRRRTMILSEGLVFSIGLVYGLLVVNRSAKREVKLARQRRNFMLSITHELKSPLASIRLVLETQCRRDLPREQVEKLCRNGLKDTARLQSLVNDLLLAARLEDNWRPLPEPVDLPALARDSVAGLLVRFPQAQIHLDVPENFPPVQADKAGLTAVVQNLLENAVKYSPEGAPVTLSAGLHHGRVRLQVADQGPGIPDGEKNAVFEKFYRLGNEETRQATGTGLGLYIVSQVVKAHGGQVQVTDNHPQGAVFTLDI